MFRSKKDVDRHVQDIFHKLHDENERTMRCFKIAELYYHVCEFEIAKRHLSRYLEVRKEAKAYKLMGKILEALGQKEAALTQYKFAFELGFTQEDIILKVCKLMADPKVEIDNNQAKHWIDRAEKLFPHDKIVFKLKEKILLIDRPSNNNDDLEKLITAELAVRKKDVELRVKLLRLFIEKKKFNEAYKHAIEIEVSNIHRDSLLWYQVLCELFYKCRSCKQSNFWAFWILYLSAAERCAALALKEQGNSAKKSSEAIQTIFCFDQILFEAKGQSYSNYQSLTESIFSHMWGQLHFHMACLLLLNTKRDQGSWVEASRLSTPLLLIAMHVKPINIDDFKNLPIDSSVQSQLKVWYREGSYRCHQAGHVLYEYCRGNQKMLFTNIEKVWTGSWRERVYQRIFVSKNYQNVRTSYFTNNNATYPPLRLITRIALRKFSVVAEEVWPYSLHHQVWRAIKSRSDNYGIQPNLYSNLFPELQFSVYNVNQASPVTLCRLDIDAFLNAAALCATAVIEEQHRNLYDPDRLPVLPADLTNPYCTEDQEKWWSAAYKMYRKEALEDLGDIRQNLQRGLEVIRCVGNHGLHPTILVHLARMFHYRANILKNNSSDNGNKLALEARSELYWSAVIPLLERLQNNQAIHSSNAKLFNYIGKDMSSMKLTHAIKEGKLLLAHKLLKDNLYEQAIEVFQELKCPEASFEQGKIYKKLADENNCLSSENISSETTSEHKILLLKARNCFYLTLDRLRSPGADPNHRLNKEIHTYINTVENELPKFDQDLLNSYSNDHQNDYDDHSEESYSSAQSDEKPVENNSLTTLNNSLLQTPMKTVQHVPKLASTPQQKHQDILHISQNRNEARPSPERLDAQIRQLVHSIDTLKEQNREQHKVMISKLDELIRISARKENQNPHPQKLAVNRNLEEDLYGLYGDEDYRDFNNYSNSSIPTVSGTRSSTGLAPNLFATTPRHPYSPLVYPSPAANAAATLQGYYQGGPLPFPDPGASVAAAAAAAAASQHMSALYPAGVYSMPSLYRGGLEQPIASMQQMTENALQHSLFAQRLAGQLPDYLQPQTQNLQAQQQLGQQIGQIHMNDPKFSGYVQTSEASLAESINPMKDNTSVPVPTSVLASAPISVPTAVTTTVSTTRKVPPVNVVITTSDTLPTTVPLVQPTLSVTIPAQHRLGVSPVTMTQDPNGVPHGYQISMPLQPTILTTVNLPPLSTTITTTSPITKPQVTDKQNSSILSTDSYHSVSDAAEIEHDPIPDFAPIVPLPDEVPVTTGEEDEETLFSVRAKLFRFADKEWKDRGVGIVKLLRNADGKVRLLMRREQVHKICANHMLRRDMEINMMPNNNRAYVWVANDFADEELKLEKLCIKFKTVEEANDFKYNFDKAKDSLPPDSGNISSMVKPVTKPTKVEASDKKPMEKIGGFSFTSAPIIQKSTETSDVTQKKPEEMSKPSPFASLSFAKPFDASATTTSGFSFNIPTVTASQPPTFSSDPSKTTLRRPQITAPVKPIKENEKSQIEDDEVVITKQSTNLMQYDADKKTWKEKGSGLLTVLSHKPTEKIRFWMSEESSKKVIYNQVIPETTAFNLRDTMLTWTIGGDKGTSETYAARFKSSNQASTFHKTLTPHLQKSTKMSNKPASAEQKSLSEIFKPPAGSWECKDCYTRNNVSATSCVACQGLSPNAGKTAPTTAAPATKPLSQMFKVPGSWECMQCSVINNQSDQHCSACEFSKDLSIKSKSKPGTNFLNDFETPEPKTTFTFGIPQSIQQTPGKETLGFNFGQSAKSSDKAASSPICIFGANKTEATNSSGFIFGIQPPNTPTAGGNDEPFIFGSPGKSFDFQYQSPPVKSPERAETSDEEVVEEAEDVYFVPVIPLPDKVDLNTGEENEDILYTHRAKLFKYDNTSKEWKERGLGDIKLLKHKDTKKLRLVMRRDQVLKLCLNHIVTDDLKITPKDEKTWLWSAGDYSEGQLEYMQLACRFKTSEIAEEFKKAIDDACKSISSDCSEATESVNDSLSDIQIVYELKVTAEEKAAALKLQLPENFYAYKYKENCPGCIGCQDFDESASETNKTKEEPAIGKANQETFTSRTNDVASTTTTTSSFSFNNVFRKPTTTTPTTTQSDSGLTMIFGASAKPIFGDGAKSTDFVFGSQASTKPTDFHELSLEHLKTCSATTKAQPSSGTATATTNIFSGFGTTASDSSVTPAKPLFGSTLPIVSDASKNPAAPVFGSLPFSGINANATAGNGNNAKPIVFGQSHLSTTNIFGGSKPPAANIFEVPSSFDTTLASTTTTTTSMSALNNSGSIFGTSTTTKSMFGGQTTVTPTFGSLAVEGRTPFGTFGSGLFGTSKISSLNTKTTAPTTTNTTLTFGSQTTNQFTSNITFGNNIAPSTKIFDAKPLADDTKKEDVNFLMTENTLSFSTLKNASKDNTVFKQDPNFTFDGAGSSVFGNIPVQKTEIKTPSKNSSSVKKGTGKNEDDEEGDEENENGDEHDPYFEPIVPLPDTIEVRTGEEEEIKLFCERAKLYRYDPNTKEWKERGVGEMKLLRHVENVTYRLLMRREQVHKVVCNFLLSPQIEFHKLSTSEFAWIWAGMNYADTQNPEVEKLAVRFKSSEISNRFKSMIDQAQQTLINRLNQDSTSKYEDNEQDDDYNDNYAEYFDEDEDEEDEEVEEDDDDEQENEDGEEDDNDIEDENDDGKSTWFENLMAFKQNNEGSKGNTTVIEQQAILFEKNQTDQKWVWQDMGNVKVTVEGKDFSRTRIIFENNQKQIISNTVVTSGVVMQNVDNELTWSAVDNVEYPAKKRALKFSFSSVPIANEMYNVLKEATNYARKLGIHK